MPRLRLNRVRLANAMIGVLLIPLGVVIGQVWLMAAGIVGSVYAGTRMLGFGGRQAAPPPPETPACAAAETPRSVSRNSTAEAGDLGMLIDEMLLQGRYALLLRPQIVGNLNDEQFARTLAMLKAAMSQTPAGEVAIGDIDPALDDGQLTERELEVYRARIVPVEGVYLDRYPVTNRQFYHFVASGGYEQTALWDPEVWPAVMDFVDQTGSPGPRYWHDGRYQRGQEHHPVVGVSWYEAVAYARWVGKRLATDAEWIRTASWPVSLAGRSRTQRRYPWGQAMDRSRANLWGSPASGTVAVDKYPEGASAGGVHQLIGNVWEWTADELAGESEAASLSLAADHLAMRSLRGGAFDTYFDAQATCQFQSGDHPLARKHNIGFRCALGLCDLAALEAAVEPASEQAPLALMETA